MPPKPSAPHILIDIEVRYAETDQMGHVHHGVHVVWFELARTRLCGTSGFSYKEIEEMGYFLLVTGVETRYLRPILYGSNVEVECWLERMASRQLRFGYAVHQAGQKMASGATEHIWFDRAKQRPCRLPETLSSAFERLVNGCGPDSTPHCKPAVLTS